MARVQSVASLNAEQGGEGWSDYFALMALPTGLQHL
ncbi:MAG: hypothetical protein IPP81_11390 [Chitinophagaceae bacterium]|nr:hypothetical protein [Chitinophagaceae bacterium]